MLDGHRVVCERIVALPEVLLCDLVDATVTSVAYFRRLHARVAVLHWTDVTHLPRSAELATTLIHALIRLDATHPRQARLFGDATNG